MSAAPVIKSTIRLEKDDVKCRKTWDKSMRIWLACFVVLFALAELFDWVKDLSLPLPIYILGGAFLAIASNYDKLIHTYHPTGNDITEIISDIPHLESSKATSITLTQELQPPETVVLDQINNTGSR